MSTSGRPAQSFAIAVDGSPASQYAFQWAIQNLVLPNDEVVILHVRNDYSILSNVPMLSEVQKLDEVLADELVRQYCMDVKAPGVQVSAELLQGDPAMTLTQYCKAKEPSQLIIGTRGRTGLVKFLLGSVSDYVIQNVSCPVTVVKTPNGWAESNAKVLDLPGMFSE